MKYTESKFELERWEEQYYIKLFKLFVIKDDDKSIALTMYILLTNAVLALTNFLLQHEKED